MVKGRRTSKDKALSLDNDQRRVLLDSLQFDQMNTRQITIKNAHAKSCRWLLTKLEYINWLDTTKLCEHHGFWWIKGMPGTGKSTLMRFALANARKLMRDRTIISLFFNARGEDIEKSTIGTYQSLLLQLERHPTLQCVFDSAGLSSSSIRPDHEWAIESLKSLLEQAIQNLGQSSIVCFINALDECEEEQFLVLAGIRFQVCFSSRHYPHITTQKGLSLVLEGKIAQQIRIELQGKASGVFIWVVLVVLFAKQLLSPEQLYFAILSGVEPKAVSKWDHDEVTKDAIELFILDSKGLAEITTSRKQTVQFIHQSVRDFLLKEDRLGNVWPDLRSNLYSQSHDQLKKCCLVYLSMDVFTLLKIPTKVPKTSSQPAADLRKSANHMFPFLGYVVQKVLHHADLAGSGIAQSSFILSFLRPSCIKLANLFERHQVCRYTEEMSLLHVLGERNMPALIGADPSAASCLEVGNERYGPPLLAASAIGSEQALQAFVNALSKESLPGSYLHNIQAHNYEDRVYPKLGHNFQFSNCRSILSYLAELGNEVTVKLLLSTGKVDFDAKISTWRQTPLLRAAANGNEAVVKLLLSIGKVDVEGKSGSLRQTLLWCAAANGYEAVVKLLLSTGKVNVDIKDSTWRQTPLSRAAANGHEAVIKLLLSRGKVHIKAKDSTSRRTPLWRAAANGHEAVVKLLLNTGKVDVNAKDKDRRTPLWEAAANGHEAVVNLLRT
ncbi:ankyrin [Lojkania enalia]|uniref:Ankyrin n=1 Tax=Lojkania enalia TaxID=147567 RepID=A0A9P4MUH9_9PLEO|nr:ankyrin [Didymosphaeria enalia]